MVKKLQHSVEVARLSLIPEPVPFLAHGCLLLGKHGHVFFVAHTVSVNEVFLSSASGRRPGGAWSRVEIVGTDSAKTVWGRRGEANADIVPIASRRGAPTR